LPSYAPTLTVSRTYSRRCKRSSRQAAGPAVAPDVGNGRGCDDRGRGGLLYAHRDQTPDRRRALIGVTLHVAAASVTLSTVGAVSRPLIAAGIDLLLLHRRASHDVLPGVHRLTADIGVHEPAVVHAVLRDRQFDVVVDWTTYTMHGHGPPPTGTDWRDDAWTEISVTGAAKAERDQAREGEGRPRGPA